MSTHPDNANLPVSNRPETILSVTIVFLIVAIFAVSLRLYVRFKERMWGYDELFVFLAGISTIVGSCITCLMPSIGFGKHFWTLSEDHVITYFKYIWATNVTYASSAWFVKLAILFQYLRLFDKNLQPAARKLTWGLLIFIGLWGLAFVLLALFACRPISKNWNFHLKGTCVAWGSKDPDVFFASWIAHSASNMTLDILVFILPIPFIHQLRMSGRTRIGLIALFAMGGIVVIIAVARVVSLSIRRAGTVPIFDPTYATPTVYIFSVLEINVAILCASIPVFWPYVTQLAMNKILIVNEVEVRTERRSQNIALTEQGLTEQGKGGDESPTIGDIGLENDQTLGRIATIDASCDIKPHRSNSRIARSLSRSRSRTHKHKTSIASSHKDLGVNLGRPSQDSQRNLKLSHQHSNGSFSSASPPDGVGVGLGLELSADSTVARYQDKYMQEWAVPDFNSGAPRPPGTGSYTTTVERAEIPYDHIRALEK